jgi:hypothetical protein
MIRDAQNRQPVLVLGIPWKKQGLRIDRSVMEDWFGASGLKIEFRVGMASGG